MFLLVSDGFILIVRKGIWKRLVDKEHKVRFQQVCGPSEHSGGFWRQLGIVLFCNRKRGLIQPKPATFYTKKPNES